MRQAVINTSVIAEEMEAVRRQQTQDWIVNNKLEGIEPTKDSLALVELYNKGYISVEEYGQRVRAKYAHYKER